MASTLDTLLCNYSGRVLVWTLVSFLSHRGKYRPVHHSLHHTFHSLVTCCHGYGECARDTCECGVSQVVGCSPLCHKRRHCDALRSQNSRWGYFKGERNCLQWWSEWMSTASWEGFTYMWVERGRVDRGGGYIKVGEWLIIVLCNLFWFIVFSSLKND